MGTVKEVSHIPKFDGTNFPQWKYGTWLILEQHELIPVVEGREPIPAALVNTSQQSIVTLIYNLVNNLILFCGFQPAVEGVIPNQAAINLWRKKDVDGRNYLYATVDAVQQRTLVNCRTSHAMYERLSAQHLRKAIENVHVLQQR